MPSHHSALSCRTPGTPGIRSMACFQHVGCSILGTVLTKPQPAPPPCTPQPEPAARTHPGVSKLHCWAPELGRLVLSHLFCYFVDVHTWGPWQLPQFKGHRQHLLSLPCLAQAGDLWWSHSRDGRCVWAVPPPPTLS